jgi:hypothetical protein
VTGGGEGGQDLVVDEEVARALARGLREHRIPDQVRVGTSRTPNGTLVPIQWVQDALDRFAHDGDVEISVDAVG